MGALPHAPPKQIMVSLKPDRYSTRRDTGPRLPAHKSAAAGGNHSWRSAQEAGHDAALSIAEEILTVPREDFADRHARRGFDLSIRIDKFEAEHLCEAPARR